MSIASLAKFTVPLASSQSSSSQGLLMPKLSYRFRVMFQNFGVSSPTTELTKQVMSVSRPTVEHTDIPVDVYNSTVHLAGRYKWSTIQVKLRDDVNGAVSKLVGEQEQKTFDFYEQSSAASGGDYKFTMIIEMLDGGNGANTPTVLETWECTGCYVTRTEYGTMAYSENKVVEITLTIQPDNCVQLGASAGLGTPGFTRTVGTAATGGGAPTTTA